MKAKRQLFKAMILLIGMIAFAACSEKEEDTKPVGSSSLQVTPYLFFFFFSIFAFWSSFARRRSTFFTSSAGGSCSG